MIDRKTADSFVGPSPLTPAIEWFKSYGWTPFPFQLNAWNAFLNGKNALINAPTGSGKTYSALLGVMRSALQYLEKSFPLGSTIEKEFEFLIPLKIADKSPSVPLL